MARSAPRGTGDVVTVAELVSRADTVALPRKLEDRLEGRAEVRKLEDTAELDLGEIEPKHRRDEDGEPQVQASPGPSRPAARRAAVAAGLFVVLGGAAVLAFSSGGPVNGTPQPVAGVPMTVPPGSTSSSPPLAVATLTAATSEPARADLNDRAVETTERRQPEVGGRKPAQQAPPSSTDPWGVYRSAVESELSKWPRG